MSLTYTQFVASLANRMAILNVSSPPFQTELPNIIDAAEQRCYREVDLQDARIVDATGNLTPSSRTFTLPSGVGRFVVVEQINVITPSSATLPSGTRNPLTPISRDGLDQLWPSEAPLPAPSVPEFFALLTSQIIRVGPSPDAGYQVEVQGTARPAPLSNSNQTTLLSLYLPDLFFAAAMVVGAAYQKSFGQQADDPKFAQSWENQYQIAAKSAITEQFRIKFSGSAWSPMAAPPEASPPRN
jgi:hypothetical protein